MQALNQKERKQAFLKFAAITILLLLLWSTALISIEFVEIELGQKSHISKNMNADFITFMNDVNEKLLLLDSADNDTDFADKRDMLLSQLNKKKSQKTISLNELYMITIHNYKNAITDKEKARKKCPEIPSCIKEVDAALNKIARKLNGIKIPSASTITNSFQIIKRDVKDVQMTKNKRNTIDEAIKVMETDMKNKFETIQNQINSAI